MLLIDKFDGQYAYMSNFDTHVVKYDSIEYPHNEVAFQAQKSLDIHVREEFARAMLTPGQAKRAGKGRPFKSLSGEELRIELRPDWEKVKNSIMYEIVRAKFEQNPDIREKLLATGDAQLVEGNYWHDNYWGQCTCQRCINSIGFNQLGKTLMRVRAELGGAPYNEPWHVNYIGVQRERRTIAYQPTIVRPSARYTEKEIIAATKPLPKGALSGLLVPPCSRT